MSDDRREPESSPIVTSLRSLLAHRTPDPVPNSPEDGYEKGAEGAGSGGINGTPGGEGGDDQTTGQLCRISVEAIRPNEYQPRRRFNDTDLAALADSIREVGVLQPILVRPLSPVVGDGTEARGDGTEARGDGTEASDGSTDDEGGGFQPAYELIAGERRWRAARRAGLTVIPAIVREVPDVRSLEEAIVENLHRADLNPLEEAAAYRQLIEEFGLSQSSVADRVGKSRSVVANTLRLTRLPVAVQRMVADGRLTAGHARAVLAVPSTVQLELAERIVSDDLSVRAAEELSQRSTAADTPTGPGRARRGSNSASGSDGAGEATPGSPAGSAGVLEVQARLEEFLDTRVRVTTSASGGRITVDFADAVDLHRIFDLLVDVDAGEATASDWID